MRRDLRLPGALLGLLVALGSGCGTEPTRPTITSSAISVTLTPSAISVTAGGYQDLTATVANDAAARGVTWSLTGCSGDESVCGILSTKEANGATYYAPLAILPKSLGVKATSVTDSTRSSTAMVTLNATLWITQAPTNSGNGQTATVGTALASPLRVLVRRGAQPAAGVTVHWDSLSGGVTSSASTTTDASGIANVTWTLGQLSGLQWAIASISDTASRAATVSFAAFARPGPPARLAFRVQPKNAFAGRTFTVLPQVAALDPYGNVATDFGGSVTVTLGPGGSLAGTTTVSAVGGVASFADLSIGQTGTGYTLTATTNGIPSVTSGTFDVVTPLSGRIAFGSDRGVDMADLCPSIYVMNADGSGVVLVTPRFDGGYISCNVTGPAWSPDGTKMAFMTLTYVSSPDTEYVNYIMVMNADGTQATQLPLPRDSTHGYYSAHPAWSPDGSRIAGTVWFTAKVYGCGRLGCGYGWVTSAPRVFVVKPDGSGFLNLVDGIGPTWSPGGRIAFTNRVDILVMNADGTGVTNLTNETTPNVVNDAPAWSPDGTKIAFRSNRSGHSDLYVMNADGSGVTQVTADTAKEGRPAWSPDGTRIAFASDRDGDYEIYVMNADGSEVVQLTDNVAFDERPAWAP